MIESFKSKASQNYKIIIIQEFQDWNPINIKIKEDYKVLKALQPNNKKRKSNRWAFFF